MTLEGWSILQVDDAHTHAVQVSREGSANKIDSTRVGDRANSDFTFELDTHRCRSLYRLPAAPVFRSEHGESFFLGWAPVTETACIGSN